MTIKSNNGFSIIEGLIALFIIGVLITVGFLLDQNAKPTPAQWKTFNNKFVSFKYPANWTTTDNSAQSHNVLDITLSSPNQRTALKFPFIKNANYTSISFELSNLILKQTYLGQSSTGSENSNTNPESSTNIYQTITLNDTQCRTLTGNCNINQIIPIVIDGSNLQLLVSSGNANRNFNVTDNPSVNINSNNYYDSIKDSNNLYTLSGNIFYTTVPQYTGEMCSCGCDSCGTPNAPAQGSLPMVLSDYSDIKVFESSTVFKNMITSLESISFH